MMDQYGPKDVGI